MYTVEGPPVYNIRGFAPDHSSIVLDWDSQPTLFLDRTMILYFIEVTERGTGLIIEYNSTTTSIVLDSLQLDNTYECRIATRTHSTGLFSTVFAVELLKSGKSAL